MTDWSAIEKSNEALRLCTARLKAHRLKLPKPGDLVRVTNFVGLRQVVNVAADRWATTVMHSRGVLLLVVAVNTTPDPHPARDKDPILDPVELIFMSYISQCLVRTGTRAAGDVMAPYEVL